MSLLTKSTKIKNLDPQTTKSEKKVPYGIVILDKPVDKTSFFLVSYLRRLTGIRCIGHAGTLDPFATGVMVMLLGKPYTRKSNEFLLADKEYLAEVCFGNTTDSYDLTGEILETSDLIPTLEQVKEASEAFQGDILQVPPMYSAKKVNGKKLYELARKGVEIPRAPKQVHVELEILSYSYPHLELKIKCSSGTYIRSIAHDLGQALGCGAHLSKLVRTQVGPFSLEEAQTLDSIQDASELKIRQDI